MRTLGLTTQTMESTILASPREGDGLKAVVLGNVRCGKAGAMLSIEQNELLTHVGPGTPMGKLMRRYWHPIAAMPELKENPTKSVRLLCENLVLYKDRSGKLGLIQEACPHRRVNLLYGIPEDRGLRCPYHGWLFDETGRCLEQPAEAPDSTFKDRVKAVTYPVEELGGLIWAYLGPEPVPLVPRWETLVKERVYRQVNFLVLPSNWLQCMENSLDSTHTEWLHGHYANYVHERKGMPPEQRRRVPHHQKIGYDIFEYGIIKRRVVEGATEEHAEWAIGHSIQFPNSLSGGQWRVPVDDNTTLHVDFWALRIPPDVPAPPPAEIDVFYPPLYSEDGRLLTDYTLGQDYMAWVTQGQRNGGLAERHREKLGESDKGIILYRRLLKEQMKVVQDGGEPMNIFRDPAKNVVLELPNETKGIKQGLPSIRNRAPGQDPRTEITASPPWVNREPWTGGAGRPYYLRRFERKSA